MSKPGDATMKQINRHGNFILALGPRGKSPYSVCRRAERGDGGAGRRRHKSTRIGGRSL